MMRLAAFVKFRFWHGQKSRHIGPKIETQTRIWSLFPSWSLHCVSINNPQTAFLRIAKGQLLDTLLSYQRLALPVPKAGGVSKVKLILLGHRAQKFIFNATVENL